jgi:hypothetical protein
MGPSCIAAAALVIPDAGCMTPPHGNSLASSDCRSTPDRRPADPNRFEAISLRWHRGNLTRWATEVTVVEYYELFYLSFSTRNPLTT